MPRNLSSNAVIEQAKQELMEYFSGDRQTFDVLYQLNGTPFQKMVWEALLCVPFEKTATYGQQAQRINKTKAVRAVGTANGRKPISIIVPCHRIISADGSLTGYGGGCLLAGMGRFADRIYARTLIIAYSAPEVSGRDLSGMGTTV